MATISADSAIRSAEHYRNRTIKFGLVELLRILYRVTKWPWSASGPSSSCSDPRPTGSC